MDYGIASRNRVRRAHLFGEIEALEHRNLVSNVFGTLLRETGLLDTPLRSDWGGDEDISILSTGLGGHREELEQAIPNVTMSRPAGESAAASPRNHLTIGIRADTSQPLDTIAVVDRTRQLGSDLTEVDQPSFSGFYAPVFGGSQIDVYYSPIFPEDPGGEPPEGGGENSNFYHMYIIVTDLESGDRTYFRGGPERTIPTPDFTTFPPSLNYGDLVTEHGPYGPGTPDWPAEGEEDHRQPVGSFPGIPSEEAIDALEDIFDYYDDLDLPYALAPGDGEGNSNTAVGQGLEDLTGQPFTPDPGYQVPGHDRDIPDYPGEVPDLNPTVIP